MPVTRGHKYITASNGDGDWRGLSSKMKPGSKVGVWYTGDSVWHERILLYPVDIGIGTWVVRTPDGDQYVEQLDCRGPNGCSRIAGVGPTKAALLRSCLASSTASRPSPTMLI